MSSTLTAQVPGAQRLLLRDLCGPDSALIAHDELHRGVVAVVMRLVVLLHAEDRELLPARLDDLQRRLAARDSRRPTFAAWPELRAIFLQVHRGEPPGGLFDPDAHPWLAAVRVTDETIAGVLAALTLVGGARVRYRDVELEQIGGAYESMLAPSRDVGDPRRRARRRSGAHYTPGALTGPIVATTLAPPIAALGERPTAAQLLELKICDPAMGCGAFLLATCAHLGVAVERAWATHGDGPDGDVARHARRLVATRCLYGVDCDPMAVDLARRALQLAIAAPIGPTRPPDARPRARTPDATWTRLTHALRCGDSLVGVGLPAIAAASGLPEPVLRARLGDTARRVDHDDPLARRDQVDRVALADLRAVGDAQVDAFFAPAPHERPARPLHWELEFPEVFTRDAPGFDAVVGNPPFLGGRQVSTHLGPRYVAWLKRHQPGSGGGADLSARFFRRGFELLRPGGTLGLLATNTIAQGDTRQAGLGWICDHGGTIYAATRRLRWPGDAAVIVSVVHLRRGPTGLRCALDGRSVPRINAWLADAGGDAEPARLAANAGLSYQGCIVLGNGFLFADDQRGATPLADMRALIAADPRNAARIRAYMGGAELNTSPTHSPSRFAIDFGGMSEAEARAWPDLMAILEARVRPERARKSRDMAAWPWWQFWRARRDLHARLQGRSRVLALARVSQHLAPAFVAADMIHSEQLVLIADDSDATFAVLQSRAHESWARYYSSSLGDGLRYAPSDCFETFPFPPGWRDDPTLAALGRRYHDHRAALMRARDAGLTITYNRFHDPNERDEPLLELRDLHAQIDRAVLTAYGWPDLAARLECQFVPDPAADATTRGRRQPWRLRWPAPLRDEVLARLLACNHARAAAERAAPTAVASRP